MGYAGAAGGAGAASALDNAVTGSTYGGTLRLIQAAIGGAGGEVRATAGAGGAASASLGFDDLSHLNQSADLEGDSKSYGGAGGNGSGGSNGANGGQAYIGVVLTGKATVSAGAEAHGGAGGAGSNYGAGGAGKALLKVYGGDVTASASGFGGVGSTAGHGSAKTKVEGSTGTFSAYAATLASGGALVGGDGESLRRSLGPFRPPKPKW